MSGQIESRFHDMLTHLAYGELMLKRYIALKRQSEEGWSELDIAILPVASLYEMSPSLFGTLSHSSRVSWDDVFSQGHEICLSGAH